MALRDELKSEVATIFQERWEIREGTVVPESEALALGNEGVKLNATVLYADLAASTNMVETHKHHFSAEVYKAYLHCAAKLVRTEGGAITAYDGDRIMGVFIGDTKNTNAVRCSLKLNGVVRNIINPALRAQYPGTKFVVRQLVGIDTSELWVARTGVRGANDLVWVGRAANYAAKLTTLDATYPTWITKAVYSVMNETVKVSSDGRQMWEARSWKPMNNITIYRSNWYRNL